MASFCYFCENSFLHFSELNHFTRRSNTRVKVEEEKTTGKLSVCFKLQHEVAPHNHCLEFVMLLQKNTEISKTRK